MEASCTDLSPRMALQIPPPLPRLPPSTTPWCLWEGYSPWDICAPLGMIITGFQGPTSLSISSLSARSGWGLGHFCSSRAW